MIQILVKEISGPVNVSYGQGDRSLGELTGLGVARVTFGPMLQHHTYTKLAGGILPAISSGGNPFTA